MKSVPQSIFLLEQEAIHGHGSLIQGPVITSIGICSYRVVSPGHYSYASSKRGHYFNICDTTSFDKNTSNAKGRWINTILDLRLL